MILRLASAHDLAVLQELTEVAVVFLADRWNRDLPSLTFVVESVTVGVVGCAELYNIDAERRAASFGGFMLNGPKYMPIKSLRRLFAFAFSVLGLERIEIRALADNQQAIRFARLFSFQPEGLLRRAARVNGEAKDVIVFSLTKGDMPDHMPMLERRVGHGRSRGAGHSTSGEGSGSS